MIVGLAGHVDHGKTALVRALTGIDADRLPEEKKRGMTIDLGFAHTRLGSGATVGFVDVPGHERFLTNMLAGVLSVGTILLVVAADDGPMPQTREHLSILRLTGVMDLACVVSKVDRVDAARLAAARVEIRDMLDRAGYPHAPLLDVSNVTGQGVADVMAFIESRPPLPAAAGLFRLAIDRSFSPPGAGLVVTGTVASGTVSVGDRLLLSPSRLAARVRGIQLHHETAGTASAGDRCALAISGPRIERARLKRGDWLIDPALHEPAQRIDVQVRAVEDRGPRHASRLHVHFGTAAISGRVLTQTGKDFAAGEEGVVTIALDKPGACLFGDRVILRDDSTGRVVAGGHILDPFSPGRRVRREQRVAALAAHAMPDPVPAFHALLTAEGWADPRRFALARNLASGFDPGTPDGAIRAGPVLVSSDTVAGAAKGLTRHLEAWHLAHPDRMGQAKADLARAAGALPAEIAEAVLDLLRMRGDLVRDGVVWRLPAHKPSLSPSDEALWTRIHACLAGAELRPPRVRELAETEGMALEAIEAALRRFERFGRLLAVAANRYFLPETVADLARIADDLAAGSEEAGFTAAEFNKQSGIGRNLAIIVLEYLDRMGLTRRAGDLRYMARAVEDTLG